MLSQSVMAPRRTRSARLHRPWRATVRFCTILYDFAASDHANIAESSLHRGRAEVALCAISSPRSPTPACLPLHVLAQRPIDARLIALTGCRVALEPGDDIGV